MTQYKGIFIAAIAVIALGIGGYMVFGPQNGELQPVQLANAQETQAEAKQESQFKAIHSIGSDDAPLTIIEYASMTCGHCAMFHTGTYKELKAKYIDTGLVRLEMRPFPLDGYALRASMLASCSGPDRYFAYLDVLFAQQAQWTRTNDPLPELKKIARLGGMSGADFDACMADRPLSEAIIQSAKDGQKKHGVNSTPSFVIDGKLHSGGMSFEKMEELIKPHLN